MNPELITLYREAFTPPILLFGASFIPTFALLVILLWVAWPQKKVSK